MMLILLRLYGVSYSLTPVVFISAIMHHFREKCNCFFIFSLYKTIPWEHQTVVFIFLRAAVQKENININFFPFMVQYYLHKSWTNDGYRKMRIFYDIYQRF